jgi:hypothetical protein
MSGYKICRVLSIDVGIINLAFCITEFTTHVDGEVTFELIHIEKVQIGTMKTTAKILMESVIDFFRSSEPVNDKPINYIFIEQQLSRAIKNCILAYVIMSHFYTESIIASSDVELSFVSPRMKFASIQNALGDNDCLRLIDFDRQGSRDLKKLSIEISRAVFTEFDVEKGKACLVKYRPKLDDVCDAFLQSFAVFLDGAGDTGNPLRSRRLKKR